MRDDAYEGVPSIFDLVKGKAAGKTEAQVYAEHGRKAGEKADKRAKTAGFMDHVKALMKEPALVAAVAAPLVGAGLNEVSKHRTALRQAKAKADSYRTMMELHPRLRIHDQNEIGRIYNTLHNVNPTMGNDPLIAGAWIDNIMENKGALGEASSNQALLNAVKDLSGIRSSLSQALRNERGDKAPGKGFEDFVTGLGKDVEKLRHSGIDAREKATKKLWDDREAGFKQLVINEGQKIRAQREQVQAYAQDVHSRDKKAGVASLRQFFETTGIT